MSTIEIMIHYRTLTSRVCYLFMAIQPTPPNVPPPEIRV